MTDGEADLRSVLAATGIPAPAAAPPDLGSPGRTHVFVVGDVVVKCDDRFGTSSMIRERSALELLSGSGLPVPAVIASGEFADTRRWIVLERLAGEPPADADQPAHELSAGLARQLGSVAARLHAAARPPGFGSWALGHGRSLVEEERLRLERLVDMARAAEIVSAAELERLAAMLGRTLPALEVVTEPVLAHRDVQPRNVLVTGDAVSALIDFESCGGGDRAEDFRVVGLDWTSPGYAAFCDGYAAAGGSLGPDGAERVLHHVLGWALVVFSYLGGIAPAYLAPARAAIARAAAGERPCAP